MLGSLFICLKPA
uniref:Uncharacterized protein n=1 Tax=Arundo donax TaxID=35708 RepID=A0A0A9BZ48_ARUDO